MRKRRSVAAVVVAASMAGCGGDVSHEVRNQASAPSPDGAARRAVPERMARGFGSLWVAEFRRSRVLRLDLHTRSRQGTVDLALPNAVAVGDTEFVPSHIATGAGAVWVSTARGCVARIAPATNRVTAYIKTASDATGDIAIGAGAVWVGEGAHLARIDPATADLTRMEPVGPDGLRMGIGPAKVCRNAVRVAGETVRS